jgi:hypothetical protein
MRNREKILNIIEKQSRDEILKDIDPKVVKIIQENVRTSQDATPAPEATGPVDKTIPSDRHEFENLVEAYMLKFNISKIDALRRVTTEHPNIHRSYLQFHNQHRKID